MLKQVRELPELDCRNRGCYTAADIREFLRSGMSVAEISYPDHRARDAVRSAGLYIKKHRLHDQVRAVQRGKHAYLVSVKVRMD